MPLPSAEQSGYALIVAALLVALASGLMPAVLAGLLVRETALLLEPRFASFGPRARAFALGSAGVLFLAALSGIAALVAVMVSGEGGVRILSDIAAALAEAKVTFPAWVSGEIPATAGEIQSYLSSWLRDHSERAREISGMALRSLAILLIGAVVGALSLFYSSPKNPTAFISSIEARLGGLSEAFSKVVFAQVKIAAINAALTAALLYGILPLFGIELPFRKTALVITFAFGLIPIVGNIASNAFLFLIGLTHSAEVAVAMLGYLILIHTAEHFMNAFIIGRAVRSRAIELLPAMLLGETLFGVSGLVSAPVIYAWAKWELARLRWI